MQRALVQRGLVLGVLCLSAVVVPTARAADAASKKMYTVSLKVTEQKDGQSRTLAEPILIAREGEETGFVTGGATASIDDAAIAPGLQAKFTIHDMAGDKVRVALLVANNDLQAQDKSTADYTVVQTSVRSVKSIQRGQAATFDMGEGRQATLVVYPASK